MRADEMTWVLDEDVVRVFGDGDGDDSRWLAGQRCQQQDVGLEVGPEELETALHLGAMLVAGQHGADEI
jgi:hypothetical protein